MSLGHDLETSTDSTGFSVSISCTNGRISVTSKSRFTAGEPLDVVSNDNVSEAQLYAICEVLDTLP